MSHAYGTTTTYQVKKWNGTTASTAALTINVEPDGMVWFTASRDENGNTVGNKIVIDSPKVRALLNTINALV